VTFELPCGIMRHMAEVVVLDREMFAVREAANLLRVPESTLRWWLEGGVRRGKAYPPVIRPEPTGSGTVTWGEFVEGGLLRQYRRVHDVKLSALRQFIDRAREEFGVPYPLAHERPFVGVGRQLVRRIQDDVALDAELCLVAEANDQLLLTPAADAFVSRVVWNEDLAVGWRPHDDPASPVRMEPLRRFGRPSIHGISTAVLWEQLEAGADFDEVAEDFDLTADDVRWAHAYETSVRSSAA
jgi:uncharacterized protein (DUF433 family)